MIPVSRRTIASAIRRWRSSAATRSPGPSARARPLRREPPRPAARRGAAAPRTGSGGRCASRPESSRIAPEPPGGRPPPGRSRSTYQKPTDGSLAKPGDAAPDPGDQVGGDHRDPDARGGRLATTGARQTRSAGRGSEYPLADAENHYVATCTKSVYNSAAVVLRSYLPVIVFAGLGVIVGGALAMVNGLIGPRRPSTGEERALRVRAAHRGLADVPLRGQLLHDRDAVHPVRHRGRLPVPGRRDPRRRRTRSSSWSRSGSSSSCCWSRWLRLAKGSARLEVRREKLRALAPLEEPRSPDGASRPPASRPRPPARRPRGPGRSSATSPSRC